MIMKCFLSIHTITISNSRDLLSHRKTNLLFDESHLSIKNIQRKSFTIQLSHIKAICLRIIFQQTTDSPLLLNQVSTTLAGFAPKFRGSLTFRSRATYSVRRIYRLSDVPRTFLEKGQFNLLLIKYHLQFSDPVKSI